MAVIARHLLISGRVQGVFYRNWTVDTAKELGLTGWVRNRMDGSVEAVVQGEADVVERLIALAHDGPSAARVAGVAVGDAAMAELTGFEKRATA